MGNNNNNNKRELLLLFVSIIVGEGSELEGGEIVANEGKKEIKKKIGFFFFFPFVFWKRKKEREIGNSTNWVVEKWLEEEGKSS